MARICVPNCHAGRKWNEWRMIILLIRKERNPLIRAARPENTDSLDVGILLGWISGSIARWSDSKKKVLLLEDFFLIDYRTSEVFSATIFSCLSNATMWSLVFQVPTALVLYSSESLWGVEGFMRDSWGIHEGYMNPRGIHARHFRGIQEGFRLSSSSGTIHMPKEFFKLCVGESCVWVRFGEKIRKTSCT